MRRSWPTSSPGHSMSRPSPRPSTSSAPTSVPVTMAISSLGVPASTAVVMSVSAELTYKLVLPAQ